MTTKAPDAFRTISEAAEELDLPQHVLRHWEDTFGAIRPMRRAGGRRYYRVQDLELLSGVRALLHGERYTTKGVQKIFKEHGAAYVAAIGKRVMAGESPDEALGSLVAESASPAGTVVMERDKLTALLGRLRSLKAEVASLRQRVETSNSLSK